MAPAGSGGGLVTLASPSSAALALPGVIGLLAGGGPERGRSLVADAGGGYGLDGLTERAELLGGTLRAGPDQQGLWTVVLRIPS